MTLPTILNGRSIDPQVRVLMKEFGDLPRGTVLPHQTIASKIGEKSGSARYRSVITAWKKKMLNERGVSLTALWSQGYRIDDVPQQLDASNRRWKRGVRDMVKAVRTAEVLPVEELAPHQKRARDHYMTAGVELLKQAQDHGKSGQRMLGDKKQAD